MVRDRQGCESMSNLPQLAQLEFYMDELNETEGKRLRKHTTLDWDFDKGDFRLVDGKTVRLFGIDYLRVWIQMALRTVKHTLIYKDSDFGSEHHSLIGVTFKPQFTKAEFERMIREALLVNDAITNVSNFKFSQDGSRMVIEFDVESIYGQQREGVTV